MKNYIKLALIGSLVIFQFTSCSQKKYNFAVAFKGGTYESVVESLKDLDVIPMEITNLQGSEEIFAHVNEGKAHFGIAQLDILLNAYNREEWSVKNVRFVLPLYAEELHLVAKKNIKKVYDISGKPISIGAENSGTSGTALIILKELGIRKSVFGKFNYMNANDGLASLSKGDIDAIFIVSGAPVDLLSSLPESFSKGFHLIPLGRDIYKKLTETLFHYRPAVITKESYPWLGEDIKTVSVVSSVIVNKDVPSQAVGKLIKAVFSNKAALEKAHPKWKELSNETIKWYLGGRTAQFHPAAREVLIPIVRD